MNLFSPEQTYVSAKVAEQDTSPGQAELWLSRKERDGAEIES